MFRQYNLQPLTTELSPETPVVNFKSIDEFETFLKDTRNPIKFNEEVKEESPLAFLFGSKTASAATKSYKYSKWHSAAKLNLYAVMERKLSIR
ncbi:hypothetical protein AB1282_15480 [Gottfriedia sp. S16(2024)]|uniref:hypothetical protein n=1 Tax=Gottfriedia sp. S16(2024) TaxID=3162883 RepID=UPI003D24FD0A